MSNQQNPSDKPKILLFRIPAQFGLPNLQSILKTPLGTVDNLRERIESLNKLLNKETPSFDSGGVDKELLHTAFERRMPEEQIPPSPGVDALLKSIFMKHSDKPTPSTPNNFSRAEALFPEDGSEPMDEVTAGWLNNARNHGDLVEALHAFIESNSRKPSNDFAEAIASDFDTGIEMFNDVREFSGVLTVEVEGIDSETILNFLSENVEYLRGQYPDADFSVTKVIRS